MFMGQSFDRLYKFFERKIYDMKRLISLVLVLSLVMALAACAEGKVYDVVYLVDGKPGWQKKKCRRHCLNRQ